MTKAKRHDSLIAKRHKVKGHFNQDKCIIFVWYNFRVKKKEIGVIKQFRPSRGFKTFTRVHDRISLLELGFYTVIIWKGQVMQISKPYEYSESCQCIYWLLGQSAAWLSKQSTAMGSSKQLPNTLKIKIIDAHIVGGYKTKPNPFQEADS